jgi:hypothetical protein
MLKRIEDPRARSAEEHSVVQRCSSLETSKNPTGILGSTCVVRDKIYTHRRNARASVKPAMLLGFNAGRCSSFNNATSTSYAHRLSCPPAVLIHRSYATIFPSSRPHQAIKQRPSKHKATQPAKHLAQPHIAQRPVKVRAGLPVRFQGE